MLQCVAVCCSVLQCVAYVHIYTMIGDICTYIYYVGSPCPTGFYIIVYICTYVLMYIYVCVYVYVSLYIYASKNPPGLENMF